MQYPNLSMGGGGKSQFFGWAMYIKGTVSPMVSSPAWGAKQWSVIINKEPLLAPELLTVQVIAAFMISFFYEQMRSFAGSQYRPGREISHSPPPTIFYTLNLYFRAPRCLELICLASFCDQIKSYPEKFSS